MLSIAVVLTLTAWPVELGGPCPAVDGGVAPLRLAVGTQRVLHGYTTAAVKHPDIAEAKWLRRGELLIIGAGYGNTELVLGTDGGVQHLPVHVRSGAIVCGIFEFKKRFPCGSTLQLEQSDDGTRFRLIGVASSSEEWRVAHELVTSRKDVVLEGTLRPDVIEQEFREAQAALERAGFTRLKWARSAEQVQLVGVVMEDDRPKLAAIETFWRPRLELVSRR